MLARLLTGLLFVVMGAQAAGAATISISCGAVGRELELCREGAEAWASQRGHEVQVVSTPNSATERLALYQQLLAARSADIDVFQIDVIWPGILANHLIALDAYVDAALLAEHFRPIADNNRVAGRLVAIPWFTDAGLLYYRADLLAKHGAAVPTTWAELAATARRIQAAERQTGAERMWGFVFQAKAYEGLTCNALEWIDSHGGGAIVEANGDISIDNPRAAAALDTVAGWIGTIAPVGVLNYAEEEARAVFQSGNAVFMRNWPYAWALGNAENSPVRGKIGVTVLPRAADGKHTGTLGGWQLAVSKYSRHPALAADLVLYLTVREEQKRRAIAGAYNPTIAALYRDPEVLAANPFMGQLQATFTSAVARPSRVTGAKYNRVSAAFFSAVHATLSGDGEGADNLARLARRLERLGGEDGW